MSAWNSVKFEGNVGKEPERKTTAKGATLTTFSIAVYTGKEKPPMWLQVKTTGNVDVNKGQKVRVEGSLYSDEWEAKDGNKRTTWGVWADSVTAIDRKEVKPEDVAF